MKTVLKILLPILVLSAVGVGVFFLMNNKRELKPQLRVEVLPLVHVVSITPKDHRFKVRSQGEVVARTEINLVSEVSGKVNWVASSFAEGGYFEKDDVLLKIDPRDFQVAAEQSRATVAQADVRLQREQAEAKVARKEWEALGRDKEKANSLLLREPQLAEAQAALSSAKASLAKSELDLARCEITAPFTGRIRQKAADVGQFINRGANLARVYAVDYVEIKLPLSLDELGFVDLPLMHRESDANSKPTPVTLHGKLGGEIYSWTGQLVRTEGEVNSRTRMLSAIARVNDPYNLISRHERPPLAVGLFVDAVIDGRTVKGIYEVPRSSMRDRETLLVVDAEDRLRMRKVSVLRFLRDDVLLRSGLEAGDRVCLSILDSPVEGMQVRATELERGATVVGQAE